MRPEAVVLDVGGVLLVPDPQVVGDALRGIDHEPEALGMAHYEGVGRLDATPTDWDAGGAPRRYLEGFVAAAKVPASQRADAVTSLRSLFARPAIEVWRHVTPWARSGLRELEGLGLPAAIVSNADGTVEEQLRLHGLAQLGPGPGLQVAAIVDSAVVGVAKPAPAVFDTALDALGVAPAGCLYVGDTVTYDVVGARAAGLRPVHLDPLAACGADDHPHARDLTAAVRHGLW
jgi:putative hydrolase of the HAD superfamily